MVFAPAGGAGICFSADRTPKEEKVDGQPSFLVAGTVHCACGRTRRPQRGEMYEVCSIVGITGISGPRRRSEPARRRHFRRRRCYVSAHGAQRLRGPRRSSDRVARRGRRGELRELRPCAEPAQRKRSPSGPPRGFQARVFPVSPLLDHCAVDRQVQPDQRFRQGRQGMAEATRLLCRCGRQGPPVRRSRSRSPRVLVTTR